MGEVVMQRAERRRHHSALTLGRELVSEIILERRRGFGHYITEHVDDDLLIAENRRFATERFASLGKINPIAVDQETGLLCSDKLHESGKVRYVSTTHEGELVSVGKLIWAPGLPMAELRTPFEEVERLNPGLHERLDALADGSIGELGSLAKKPGTSQVAVLSTLSEIYRLAEDSGVQYMMAGLEPGAWPRYRVLFGSGIELVSETPLQYPGIIGDQVGICMNITEAYEHYRDDFHHGSMAIRAQRLLVSELYANRVRSFQSCLGRRALRKLP